MKIAIVSEYYYPLLGGITEHVHFFSEECSRLGHKVTIVTSNPYIRKNQPAFPTFKNNNNIEVIRLGRSVPIYSNGSFAKISVGLGLKRKMSEIFESEKFDIVHIHSPTIAALPIFAQYTSTGPTVGTFHTYFDSNLLYFIFRAACQDAIENLDGRIAVSKLCVEALSKYFSAEFRIIPNGVDVDYFSIPQGKLNKFDDGKINILFLARLDPRNGLECLIKAFKIAHSRHKDIRLIIVGDGPLKPYYHLLVDHQTEKDVHFEGFACDLRPDYYSLCDIFCFPVQKASFGITILEAMAAGKAIVCSDLQAFRDILGSDGSCQFVDPYDEHDLAEKLITLIENKDLRKTMGQKAREKVDRFSWKNVTREVVEYYNEILGSEFNIKTPSAKEASYF